MGHSFHQFKALFWKNWLCRLRSPILSLSEVLWPCMLFLILAVVRFQEPPIQRENCYLEARDLPSRGLYPFVQSLFCNVGSRCKNSSYTAPKKSRFRASSFQHDHNSITDPLDMTFLKDIKELMQGIKETTKKAATLQTLWEERSKLLDPAGSSVFLGMNLSETEKMISTVEHFYNQPYFWDLLYSLPWLQTSHLSQEHGIEYLSELLHTIQKKKLSSAFFPRRCTLFRMKENELSLLRHTHFPMLRRKESWCLRTEAELSFQYNICLGDVVWNPSVKTELESQLGFEKIYIDRVLNYTMTLNKIPTKDTLEQLVCSVLNMVSEAESDKGGSNKRDCIFPPWLEAQTYLVHSVDQIKLYIKILILFSSLETLFMNKLQAAVQNLSQWPFVKKLFLVDGAIRNSLMSDAPSGCNDAFMRSLGLPPDSEIGDVLEEFVCYQNGSSESSKLRNRIHLVKESIQLLQSMIHGQHDLPVSITEGYLGWQEIGEQLAETSASCREIMKSLGKTRAVEDAALSSCQEQLIQSLFWDTLDELWFDLEKNLYWKSLATIVRRTCEMAYYANEGDDIDSLATFLYQNSNNISTPFPQFDFQGVSQAFAFLSSTVKVLQDFPPKSFCEKLLMLYSYLELPAQSLVQDGEQETETIASMLNNKNSIPHLDAELARKVLQMLTSYIFPNSLGKLDTEVFTKDMVALLQNLEKKDVNFSQLRQVSRSLNSKVHVGQEAENSVPDFLAVGLKNISNTSPLWNSPSVWQILKLFQEAELTELMQILHFLPEVVSLFGRAAHKNMTDALIEGYHLMQKQSANMAALSMEELSNEVNSLVELLEQASDMPLESTKALSCLAAVICRNITTTSRDESVSKACNTDLQKYSSTVHEVDAEIFEQLKMLQLQGESLCSDQRFLKEATYKIACFLGQLEEWHPVILKFSEIHPADSSVLNELLAFWNQLSNYVLTSRTNGSNLSHCMLMGGKQTTLQLVEKISNLTLSEISAVMALFEQLADFYSNQNAERSTATLRTKTVLTHLQHVAQEVFRFNDTKDILTSFLSSMHPLMALSSAGNQLQIVLRALLALARNDNLRESLETLWFETERDVENLPSGFNIRHLLLLIAKEFHLLSTAIKPNTLSVLATALRPLNASFLHSFEDVLELGRKWLEEYNSKNYSKIINALISLTADKSSSNDIIKSIKDIISFLELFKNETKGDNPISFVIDFLSGRRLKNNQVAHLILQNSLLNVIYDLTAKEEELHSNDTENQIMEFIDLFFDDTQYENYGKDIVPSQSRTMELVKQILQIAFPSSKEHHRNKIFFLLKDLHKDVIAEMSGEFPFDGAKGLMFARNIFNLLLRNPTVKNITRTHEELLGFVYSLSENRSSPPMQGICENFVYLKKKLSSTLAEFQRVLYNTTNKNCECRRVSESIQKHIEMLTEAVQAPLAGHPLMAFLRNFSLPTDVKIKDCLQNSTELVRELRSLTNISDNTINTVMESSISYPKFLSSTLTAALVGRCDVEALSPLLMFPTGDSTADAVKELCSLPPQKWYTVIVLLLKNLNVRNVIYKIKMPSEVDKLLGMLLDVVSNISSLLKKAQRIFENLPAFLETLKSTSMLDISSFHSIFQNREPRSLVVGSLPSLIKGVCKEDASFFSNTNIFIDMPRITEVLEEDMAKFSIPEDSTPFCLQLYQEILKSPNGALIWTFLKPLLHGKILYTPDTKNINLVMQKANRTFGFVEDLKTYSEAWLRMTELVENSDNFLMINQLQEALQNPFVKNFVESQLHLDVGELMAKLQVYETMIEKMLNNSATEQINLLAQLMGNISSCLRLDRFQPVESVEKLEAKAHELMQQNNFLASVIFNASIQEKAGTNHEFPKNVSYTIRTSILYSLRTDLIKNPVWKAHPQNLPADGFKYNHIFIPLQDMIERAIISVHTGVDTLDAGIQVQAMPYPCHTSDLFLNNIGFFFPLIMMLTWMVSVASMVRKLVYEREMHLEEYMKTMGVPPGIHILAWFLENFVVLGISSCALTVILKVSGIFAYSDCFLVFLFFLDFGVSIAMFSYLLSVFFSSANTAALCASLMYMISFLPYVILLVLQNQLSFANQTFVCFLSTTAFGQGVFLLTLLEGQEQGIHWNNIYQPLAKGGPLTFGWACWMILFDSVIYFIVGWYFSNVIPGRFGLKRSWYFPFTLSFWKNMCSLRSKKQSSFNPTLFFVNETFQGIGSLPKEPEKGGEGENPVGVTLRSLTKEYPDSNKIAIKELSLTFYKGHITALLGPNGAGKTTVMSMLTGLFPPSSGTIIVNGKDMETDLAAIWTEMGVCPQYNVLFDSLTVQEHLLLYGTVKAPLWTKLQLHQQVARALTDVGLFQHQYKHIRALSGGMKRRLSVAISFIGNSKTVVLDEPTSGVDPCSRRRIWDILLKYKAGRTLIFTTHHLDEAEALSDHIAILQHGQLRCCGSPSYLKETYGQGHRLTFIKKPSVFAFEDPRDSLRITAVVQAYIPEAFLKESSGSELTYLIPPEANKASFKGLFQTLDENLQYLHLTGYGVSDTTLEEVFLKLLQSSETSQIPVDVDMEFTQSESGESTHKNGNSFVEAQSIHGARLVLTQMAALLMKRLRHTQRDWRGTLSNVLLPVIFVAMAMALFTVKPLVIDYPSLKLTPELYDNAETFFRAERDCILALKRPPYNLKYCLLVWYNQKGFHALPSYLNQLNNLILWKNLPSDVDWKQYGITLYSCPYGGALLDEDKIMENVRQCGVALCIVLGFSILTASIGSSIVKDRVSGAKRLQHISGLGHKTYWLANFLYDMLLYLVPVCLCIGIITVFQLSAFTFRENLAATALLLILFGYATLPWMYLMSRFFTSSDIAFISYISLNFVCGLCTMLVTLLPRLLAVISKGKSFQNIYGILKWAFIIFPQFCLGQGLIELAYNQIKFDLTSNFGINSYVTPLEMNFLGWIFTEMALQGMLLLLLRILVNSDLLQKPRDHRYITNTSVPLPEDIDVELERKRLFGGSSGNDLLLLYNLQKSYQGFSKRNTAVKGITLGIQRGECFGLLGANGAGKSTTFKMLTGDVIPSAGRAVIRTPIGSEMDILSALSEGIRIGYCPQQDALDSLLTGWEHLYYYCSLRGIPKQHVRKVAGDLVSRLHLDAYADELVGTYSGGTKRKLSTALALVGKPHILLLDEPSSGMDPCSKRYLWNAITKEVQEGCAAVLTSHSMEECEALCTRLAIMVNGSFKCLGSPQHIKNRFGNGYSVKMWLSKENGGQNAITECLQLHFPGILFKGQHLNLLEYHVPQNWGCLAELFRVLESKKTLLQIEHYSISQTTLEQVFINFATQEQEDSNSAQGSCPSHDCHLPV
ncbi:ATP-binding cassette sub-family A member 13 [Eublepharis macularius]|uniref:ATP-binding cassette sub-family A member 13 n=1 Tax=Eublepharis macularius TaxID=481883 RepID=A0AA97L975_EUBMA|nr:ATP-binding cassette sub-family A member 13 [Eublepharis macularius]